MKGNVKPVKKLHVYFIFSLQRKWYYFLFIENLNINTLLSKEDFSWGSPRQLTSWFSSNFLILPTKDEFSRVFPRFFLILPTTADLSWFSPQNLIFPEVFHESWIFQSSSLSTDFSWVSQRQVIFPTIFYCMWHYAHKELQLIFLMFPTLILIFPSDISGCSPRKPMFPVVHLANRIFLPLLMTSDFS